MEKKIEKRINPALEAARVHLTCDSDQSCIPSEYNGYIAAFGAAIIQSGLKPAIAFYERTTADSAQDKRKLMQAILHILRAENDHPGQESTLLDHVLTHPQQKHRALKREILGAATALKLAIRTFTLKKQGE